MDGIVHLYNDFHSSDTTYTPTSVRYGDWRRVFRSTDSLIRFIPQFSQPKSSHVVKTFKHQMALCYQRTDCSVPCELNFLHFHYILMRFFLALFSLKILCYMRKLDKTRPFFPLTGAAAATASSNNRNNNNNKQ